MGRSVARGEEAVKVKGSRKHRSHLAACACLGSTTFAGLAAWSLPCATIWCAPAPHKPKRLSGAAPDIAGRQGHSALARDPRCPGTVRLMQSGKRGEAWQHPVKGCTRMTRSARFRALACLEKAALTRSRTITAGEVSAPGWSAAGSLPMFSAQHPPGHCLSGSGIHGLAAVSVFRWHRSYAPTIGHIVEPKRQDSWTMLHSGLALLDMTSRCVMTASAGLGR
jgi:hypothetical protein